MEKITNLKEKIYFLTYGKPNYFTKISNSIYGSEKKQILPILKELKDNKWIKEVKVKHNAKEDGRSIVGRKYYFANIEPLYNVIIERLKKKRITLNKNEQNKLKKFLDDWAFRDEIHYSTVDVNFKHNEGDFSTLTEIIGWLCFVNYNSIETQVQLYEKYIPKDRRNDFIKFRDKLMEDGFDNDPSLIRLNLLFWHINIPLLKKLTNLIPYLSRILEFYLLEYRDKRSDILRIIKKYPYSYPTE